MLQIRGSGHIRKLKQRLIAFFSRALKALGLANAKDVATPGTDDVGGAQGQ